ncbi:MAG: hypothetical protein PPP56_04035 [Longimonas sp.]|uniref:hypothetical protein n=1 Tax=Longimonas sp. TaxID=2039626 RepID=UPI0033605706
MRIQSIFIGGVVVGILSTSYLSLINVLCCLGVVLGGGVASWHYVTTTRTAIDPVEGATLGAGAGIVGSLLGGLFDWILRPLSLDGESIIQGFFGEEFEQMMQGQEQAMQEPGLGAMIVGLIMGAILWAVFGGIGGAIAASLVKGDNDDTPHPESDTPSDPRDEPSW